MPLLQQIPADQIFESKRGKFFIGTKVLGYVSLTNTLVFLHNSIRISEVGVMPYEQVFTETYH